MRASYKFYNIRERLSTVFREHGNQGVQSSASLVFISCGDFDQNVFGIESDLGMIRVDDGRKRTNSALGIENNGIDGRITDDVKELAEMLILL